MYIRLFMKPLRALGYRLEIANKFSWWLTRSEKMPRSALIIIPRCLRQEERRKRVDVARRGQSCYRSRYTEFLTEDFQLWPDAGQECRPHRKLSEHWRRGNDLTVIIVSLLKEMGHESSYPSSVSLRDRAPSSLCLRECPNDRRSTRFSQCRSFGLSNLFSSIVNYKM